LSIALKRLDEYSPTRCKHAKLEILNALNKKWAGKKRDSSSFDGVKGHCFAIKFRFSVEISF